MEHRRDININDSTENDDPEGDTEPEQNEGGEVEEEGQSEEEEEEQEGVVRPIKRPRYSKQSDRFTLNLPNLSFDFNDNLISSITQKINVTLRNINYTVQRKVSSNIEVNSVAIERTLKELNLPESLSQSTHYFDSKGNPFQVFDSTKFYKTFSTHLIELFELDPSDMPTEDEIVDINPVGDLGTVNIFIMDYCNDFYEHDTAWESFIRFETFKAENKQPPTKLHHIKRTLIQYFKEVSSKLSSDVNFKHVSHIMRPLFILPDKVDYNKYHNNGINILDLTINELNLKRHDFLFPPSYQELHDTIRGISEDIVISYAQTKVPLIELVSKADKSSLYEFLQYYNNKNLLDDVVRHLNGDDTAPDFRTYILPKIEKYRNNFSVGNNLTSINDTLPTLIKQYLTVSRSLKLSLFWIFFFEDYLEKYIQIKYNDESFITAKRMLKKDQTYIICLELLYYFWQIVRKSMVLVHVCIAFIKYQVILLNDLEEIETEITKFYESK